ncbi:MAG: hypothetical protein M3O71_21120 [Bacteroidota bacterium]|nr:hypothetical protein [Bacteroidota bacterium]
MGRFPARDYAGGAGLSAVSAAQDAAVIPNGNILWMRKNRHFNASLMPRQIFRVP